MRIAQEEILGPLICVVSDDYIGEAIAIANDSDFDLVCAAFTNDPSKFGAE